MITNIHAFVFLIILITLLSHRTNGQLIDNDVNDILAVKILQDKGYSSEKVAEILIKRNKVRQIREMIKGGLILGDKSIFALSVARNIDDSLFLQEINKIIRELIGRDDLVSLRHLLYFIQLKKIEYVALTEEEALQILESKSLLNLLGDKDGRLFSPLIDALIVIEFEDNAEIRDKIINYVNDIIIYVKNKYDDDPFNVQIRLEKLLKLLQS